MQDKFNCITFNFDRSQHGIYTTQNCILWMHAFHYYQLQSLLMGKHTLYVDKTRQLNNTKARTTHALLAKMSADSHMSIDFPIISKERKNDWFCNSVHFYVLFNVTFLVMQEKWVLCWKASKIKGCCCVRVKGFHCTWIYWSNKCMLSI